MAKAKATAPLKTARGDVVLIQYGDERTPHSVVTRGGKSLDYWDFEPSKRDGCVYARNSGSGPMPADGLHLSAWTHKRPLRPIWFAEGVTFKRWVRNHYDASGRNIGSDYAPVVGAKDLAALGMRRILAPVERDPFRSARVVESDESIVYCTVCRDSMLDESPCRHIFFGTDGREGPGIEQGSDGWEVPECLKAVVRRGGIARELLRDLSQGHGFAHDTMGGYVLRSKRGRDLDDMGNAGTWRDVDLFRDGLEWLRSLDEGTPAINAKVAAWCREEIAAQDARRASGERCYAVRAGWMDERAHEGRLTFAEAFALATRLRAENEWARPYITRRVGKTK